MFEVKRNPEASVNPSLGGDDCLRNFVLSVDGHSDSESTSRTAEHS